VGKCPIDLNTCPNDVNLNVLPLGSYDVLIIKDWMEKHEAIIKCLNEMVSYLNQDGKK